MRFVVVGLSHKTAPLELRERLAVPTEAIPALLDDLTSGQLVSEAMLLSTCNRVELYAVPASDSLTRDASDAAATALADRDGFAPGELSDHVYRKTGRAAVSHLFRVAASLDSMVVGEPQILGQVKEAASIARDCGGVGPILGRLTDRAFSTAKAVRTETGIARAIVSIGSVAVDLARRIFARIEDCRVLIVGAGKMAEATARSVVSAGAARVYVCNRSHDRAVALADKHGWRARQFSELGDLLAEVDVVISSTGSPRPIIDKAMVRRAVKARKYRPLFLVDIAVPRDIASDVGDLDTVYLYNVDDLEGISRANMAGREQEAELAEGMVRGELDDIEGWFLSLALKPTLAAIRHRAETVARSELERTLGKRLKHLGDPERRALEKMADSMVSKLLHPTMQALRTRAADGDPTALVAAARLLHGVDPD